MIGLTFHLHQRHKPHCSANGPVTKPINRRYQLDLMTPGSFPWDAKLRKHIRQRPNFLMYPRGLPQIGQRLYALTSNLGFRMALFLSEVLAKSSS
jgi:hypothetical protein